MWRNRGVRWALKGKGLRGGGGRAEKGRRRRRRKKNNNNKKKKKKKEKKEEEEEEEEEEGKGQAFRFAPLALPRSKQANRVGKSSIFITRAQ